MKNNELIFISEDTCIHMYKLNAEKLSLSKPQQIATLVEPSYTLVNVSSLDYFGTKLIKKSNICVTSKSNMIVMFIHSSLIFVDSVSNRLLLQSDIEDKNQNSLQYFLSPTNLTLNRLFHLIQALKNQNGLHSIFKE